MIRVRVVAAKNTNTVTEKDCKPGVYYIHNCQGEELVPIGCNIG